MTKRDMILIFIIALLGVSGIVITTWSREANQPIMAEISVNGNIIDWIDLTDPNKEQIIKIDGPLGTSLAEVRSGEVRMYNSPCPDEYCMKTGWISKPGQTIACVPNRIVIKLSAQTNFVDTVSQ